MRYFRTLMSKQFPVCDEMNASKWERVLRVVSILPSCSRSFLQKPIQLSVTPWSTRIVTAVRANRFYRLKFSTLWHYIDLLSVGLLAMVVMLDIISYTVCNIRSRAPFFHTLMYVICRTVYPGIRSKSWVRVRRTESLFTSRSFVASLLLSSSLGLNRRGAASTSFIGDDTRESK